jgi:hypothetical protein
MRMPSNTRRVNEAVRTMPAEPCPLLGSTSARRKQLTEDQEAEAPNSSRQWCKERELDPQHETYEEDEDEDEEEEEEEEREEDNSADEDFFDDEAPPPPSQNTGRRPKTKV